MERLASVRFEKALAVSERDAAVRAWSSTGAKVSSWSSGGSRSRTYALLELGENSVVESIIAAVPQATLTEPALCVLEVVPADLGRLTGLREALAGPGRPAGVVTAGGDEDSLVLEFDERISPLRTIVDLIDAELGPACARRIVPLLPLSDRTLCGFAGATLGIAGLDPERTVETHSARLLHAGRS